MNTRPTGEMAAMEEAEVEVVDATPNCLDSPAETTGPTGGILIIEIRKGTKP